ncbi:hypothetical protein JOM56_012499 [Amanita muscaria]
MLVEQAEVGNDITLAERIVLKTTSTTEDLKYVLGRQLNPSSFFGVVDLRALDGGGVADDIVAQSLDDEQTPRANQRQTEGRAPGKINSKHDASKTGKEVVPASVDNEAKPESGRVKQPLVPSSDNDMPVENAKKPKPRPKGHGAKQVTATGAKGQATFTTYDANATTALKGRSEKQITSDMEMDGGEKINDPKTPAKQGRKIDLIDDQGEPQAASKTKSKGAAQKAPGEKANRPEVNILDSEISIDESPVKAKKKRSKPSAEEAKKEMEGLKKQVKEAKTKKRADEADLNKSATSAPHKLLDLCQYVKTRMDSHEKTVNSEPDIPSFKEDQEVEHQAMLSSPLKGRQRITSKVYHLFPQQLLCANMLMKDSGDC